MPTSARSVPPSRKATDVTIIACIVYVLIVAAVVAWLVYELRVDKKASIKPTVPGPLERLPPKSDI